MKSFIAVLCLLLLMASCEPYEPVLMKVPESVEKEKEEQDVSKMKQISAFADGMDYMLYFSSENTDFEPLYRGSGKFTGNVEIPDITPLDLWLVTVPASQDSVWLEVGCIRVATVTRIRMVMK